MLRARTIRHTASAYFTRDYNHRYSPELPHSSLPLPSELDEKRIRLHRPAPNDVKFLPPLPRKQVRKRSSLCLALLATLACCLFWVLLLHRQSSLSNILGFYGSREIDPGSTGDDPDLTYARVRYPTQVPAPSLPRTTGSPQQVRPPTPEVEDHQPDPRSYNWPPMVTQVPETRPEPDQLSSGLTTSFLDAQFCGGASPCRLLLPLWIGEQESRARIHLMQVLQFAQALNRTLVLPNVGRSRIGACGRWEFNVYYDVGSFVGKLGDQNKKLVRKVMLMDDFKTWLEMRPTSPKAQVVFIDEATTDPEEDDSRSAAIVLEDESLDVRVDVDPLDMEDPRLKKTRCLGVKFGGLDFQKYGSLTAHVPFLGGQDVPPSGEDLVKALSHSDVLRTSLLSGHAQGSPPLAIPEPEVLALYWDIRHFPFPLASPPTRFSLGSGLSSWAGLSYSPKILELADQLVDSHRPYVAVHWRMETVPPFILPDCAEALVDTLSTLLSDPTLGKDVKTVWFASDFPWPVSSSEHPPLSLDELATTPLSASTEVSSDVDVDSDQQPLQISPPHRRSNTFRSLTHQHLEAIETVRGAFQNGGVLEEWKLTNVMEELDRVRNRVERENAGRMRDKVHLMSDDEDEEEGLLEDSGMLGILDKLAGMRAALFVSGAKRCGRVSTFTKQITDYRASVIGNRVHDTHRNVVEVFG